MHQTAPTPQALRRGYVVLALTAKNERSQCWSSGGSWRTNDHSQVGAGGASCSGTALFAAGQAGRCPLLVCYPPARPPTPCRP